MNNIKNYIAGVKHTGVAFDALKQHLTTEAPSQESLSELLALLEYRQDRFGVTKLTLAALEDGIVSDGLVHKLCNSFLPLSPSEWKDIKGNLDLILAPGSVRFNRQQLLELANTFEILYARGVKATRKLAYMTFNQLPFTYSANTVFSEESLHIELARLAYGCNEYTATQALARIGAIRHDLKSNAFYHHYKGMVHYYRALCIKELSWWDEEDNPSALIYKATCEGFPLAEVYQQNHIETSKF